MSKISLCYYSFEVDPLNPLLDTIINGAKKFCEHNSDETNKYSTHFYFRKYNGFKVMLCVKINLTTIDLTALSPYSFGNLNYEVSSSNKVTIKEYVDKYKRLCSKIKETNSSITDDTKKRMYQKAFNCYNASNLIYENIDKWNEKNL